MNLRYTSTHTQRQRPKSSVSLKALLLIGLLNLTVLCAAAFAQVVGVSSSENSKNSATQWSATGPLARESFYDRVNASMCSQCHGTYGQSAEGSKIPSLAGKSAQELLTKLQRYQAAEPSSSVMARLVRGLDAKQLLTTVEYFSAQPVFLDRTYPKP